MTPTLSSLIQAVEDRAASSAPLDRLVTAAESAEELSDTADALLAHFVDQARRAGCSWTEIGAALSVSKQAVQKRFTADQREPRGWNLFTGKARRVVREGAPAVAAELEHNYVGTEHLLAAMVTDTSTVAAQVLVLVHVNRDDVIADIDARVERGTQGAGGFTPRVWISLENASRIAGRMGHDYVGTEHLLLSLLSGVGGMASEILTERGVSESSIAALVADVLAERAGGTSP
jgi:hypothetical protein